MSTIRRNARFTLRERISLTTMLVTLIGCCETPIPGSDTDFDSGIWLLADGSDKRHDGETILCRPMLMALTITPESLTLGNRVFPCDDMWNAFDELQLVRSGDSLLLKGDEVGSLTARRLDIRIATRQQRIVWDLDLPETPYSETTADDEFKARPELREDSTPFATNVTYFGTEDVPIKGFVHAARLPDVDAWYEQEAIPSNGTFGYFNNKTGEVRVDPQDDFAGQSTFLFKALITDVTPSKAIAAFHFDGTEDPPFAFDTYVWAAENSPTLIWPSVAELDGDTLSVEVVESPIHGQTEVSGRSFVYIPEPNFTGIDTFTYFASDGKAKSNVARIEITIFKTNDPPVAIDQDVHVTNESATPFTLSAMDEDSSALNYQVLSYPSSGQILGEVPNFVYVPAPGIKSGTTELTFQAYDVSSQSAAGKIRFIITEGTHQSTLLTPYGINLTTPVWNDGSRIFYTSSMSDIGQPLLGRTDGTLSGTISLHTFANASSTPFPSSFYELSSGLYFSVTDSIFHDLRLYRTDNLTAYQLPFVIQAPSELIVEPSAGNAYLNGGFAYLPVTWPQKTLEHACQIWRIDGAGQGTGTLIHTLPVANDPCFGLWSANGAQYLFSGSNLVKFNGIESPPEILKNLGNGKPEPWMVAVGTHLFFQTRTEVGSETRIDLWVTDGTEAGTQIVKEIETEFFEFNIFSPVAFAGKLYFAHRKSLWSSDGTAAGTAIVATIPTSTVIGAGAIGSISALNGKLYFLATSDAFGREPWVSDGTSAGTQLLLDVNPGPKGSAIPSLNPAYFQAWNGQVFFGTGGSPSVSGIWSTDGTTAGTNQIVNRPMHTVLGTLGTKLVYHDGHYLYSMKLQ